MNKTREKQASLLLSCGKKYLIEMGFDKEAEDPRVVLTLLKGIKTNEGLDAFVKKAYLQFGFKKQSEASNWWEGVKSWIQKPEIQKALSRSLIGVGGGGLVGGLLGGGAKGALLGGLLGGIGTGVGSYYWPQIQKMLGWGDVGGPPSGATASVTPGSQAQRNVASLQMSGMQKKRIGASSGGSAGSSGNMPVGQFFPKIVNWMAKQYRQPKGLIP